MTKDIIKRSLNVVINIVLLLFAYFIIEIPNLAGFPFDWVGETYTHINFTNHLLLFVISAVITFVYMLLITKRMNPTLTFKKSVSLKVALFTVLATILGEVIRMIISYIFIDQVRGQNDYLIHVLNSNIRWIFIIEVVLVAPILEEMLFQGIIQNVICKNPYLAIVVTAALFAFAHVFTFASVEAVTYFIAGLTFALVYQYTKDIKMAILAHGFMNLLVIIL